MHLASRCISRWWVPVLLLVDQGFLVIVNKLLLVETCMPHSSDASPAKVSITIDLGQELVDWIDQFCRESGVRSRGVVISSLLRELIGDLGSRSQTSADVSGD